MKNVTKTSYWTENWIIPITLQKEEANEQTNYKQHVVNSSNIDSKSFRLNAFDIRHKILPWWETFHWTKTNFF